MEKVLQQIVQSLFDVDITPTVTRPEPKFGDYSSNIALQLASQLRQSPRQVAEAIAAALKDTGEYSQVDIAGPGFINVRLGDQVLRRLAVRQPTALYEGLAFVLEYSCPNAFKELHTGHLYQTMYGDALARVLEAAGAMVHRTSFGGDVGLHVAKCLWGMRASLGGELPDELSKVDDNAFSRARWISTAYVAGAKAYEDDAAAKQQIAELNKIIYGFHQNQDQTSPLAKIYWITRQWSFDYFESFYELIQVDTPRYYPESSTAETGMTVVNEQLERGNLVRSGGAVVFEGDEAKHLHTRVFVTSAGLPTYETKDIGVIWKESADYNFDRRILITGNDQTEYMRVVFAAADTFQPGIAEQMTHLTNGTVRFGDGTKMSSRLGNVSRAADVVEAVEEQVASMTSDLDTRRQVALGAIKYAFAKYRIGGDISFDMDETVSLQGNSGPYIQYAHARASSILAKSSTEPRWSEEYDETERALLRKLSEYPEIIEKAAKEYMIHGICHYLYELAQAFNRFYEQARVIGDPREAIRLQLVTQYRDTLAKGLGLLGIDAPNKL